MAVDAIIFLAPLTFNTYLDEKPNVNRLEDSLQLWKEVCKNKFLTTTALILFLNKTDVLARTLADGVQVKEYIPTYDRPNEYKHVLPCAFCFIILTDCYTSHLAFDTRSLQEVICGLP
jgi:guanine nucleotide-binding protein alpha-1 subunit